MRAVVDAPRPLRVDMAVDLGSRERRVPEQLLDRAQVGAAFEQVGRVRVAQPVGVARRGGAGLTCRGASRGRRGTAHRSRRARAPAARPGGRSRRRAPPPRRAARRAPCRPCRARGPPPARSRRRAGRARRPRRCGARRSRRARGGPRCAAPAGRRRRPRERASRPRRASARRGAVGAARRQCERRDAAAPSVKRRNDRTAASRRVIVAGAAGAGRGRARWCSRRARVTSTSSSSRPAVEPAGEIAQVEAVGAPGRLGEARAVEEAVDRGEYVHGPDSPRRRPRLPMRRQPSSSALLLVAAPGRGVARRALNRSTRRSAPTRGTVTLVGDSLNSASSRISRLRLRGLEDRRQRPRRPHDRGGDRGARGRAACARPLRRRQPRHERSRRTSPRSAPTWRGCCELIGAEPVRDVGDDLARRQAGRRRSTTSSATAAAANHRLRLVEWAAMVQAASPTGSPLTASHGNETGYRERARAVGRGGESVPARRERCAMTRIVQLSRRRRGAARERGCAARRRAPQRRHGSRPLPGTWSATSELLAPSSRRASRGSAFVEVRYRLKSWKALDSCMEDARAALDLVAERRVAAVGFSMGGAVSIGDRVARRPSTGVLGLAPWIPERLSLDGLARKRLDVLQGSWIASCPGSPGVSAASSKRGFERAHALGVEGTYKLIRRGLHGCAVPAPSGRIQRLPRCGRVGRGRRAHLARFQAEACG